MDFALTSEQKMIVSMAREFARDVLVPGAPVWNREHRFPIEVFKQMGDLGLMGMLVPEEYGGSNAGTVAYVAAMEEIGWADQSVAAAWNAHSTIGSLPLLMLGNEEQKRRWLVPLAQGEYLGAFGLTEPNAGSDASAIETTATFDVSGGYWTINGTKMFISNAGTDMSLGVTLLATTGKDPNGRKRYGVFVVPRDTPGFEIGRLVHKIGWHALDTRELIFRDCRVPSDHLLGEEGRGLSYFLSVLDAGRISVAALSVSLAKRALDEALGYAQGRIQFGQPIAKHQAIQLKLADMATRIEAARLLTYQAAWLRDQGQPYTKECAMAKLFASEAATFCASEGVQIHGGYGYTLDFPISRFYLDSKILEIGEGSNEIQRLVIARELGC